MSVQPESTPVEAGSLQEARSIASFPAGPNRALRVAFLAALVVAAAALRLVNINWDQFQHVHPDERFIVWVADTISWPGDLSAAFDPARSTLNPFRWPPGGGELAGQARGYAYGHFPLYLLVLVAHGITWIVALFAGVASSLPLGLQFLYVGGLHMADYGNLSLVGRGISTVFDLGTLLLVHGLAQRAYGSWAGPLAAFAYTFAVLPIQLSHFYAVDLVFTFCLVASVALAARWAEEGGRLVWVGAGVMAGLAVGSKFSAIMVAIPLLTAALFRLPEGSRSLQARVAVTRLAAVSGAALLAFVVTNPFALIEFDAFTSNIMAQNSMVSGVMDAPYTRQYLGTAQYWYFVQQLGQWGLGWPLGIVAWGGLVWAAVEAGRRFESPARVVMLAWAVPYFAITGMFLAKFLRYMAPLLPFLLIFGSGMLLAVGRRLRAVRGDDPVSAARRFRRKAARAVWPAGLAFTALFTVAWALAFTGVYRQEHPWLQASRWIYENVPAGSKVLSEAWDDALPLAMDEVRQTPNPTYRRAELPLWEPDTPAKLDALVAELSTADYVTIASHRLSGPIPRLRRRFPMSSQYYRMLATGDLGYELVAEFAVYPQLGGGQYPG